MTILREQLAIVTQAVIDMRSTGAAALTAMQALDASGAAV